MYQTGFVRGTARIRNTTSPATNEALMTATDKTKSQDQSGKLLLPSFMTYSKGRGMFTSEQSNGNFRGFENSPPPLVYQKSTEYVCDQRQQKKTIS